MAADMEKILALASNNFEKLTALQKGVSGSGESEKGRVKITLSGEHNIKALTLDPALLKERNADEISRLIITAFNRARNDLDKKIKEGTISLVKDQVKDL